MNQHEEVVEMELPRAGKYRVRILEGQRVDVREYIDTENFKGFTRKGIRLSMKEFEEMSANVLSYTETDK